MSIDWLPDFEKKFSGDNMIATLKGKGFHGKLEINFAGGSPHSVHVNRCVKPYAGSSTLKEGGE